MIASENDNRVFPFAVFLENFHEPPEALIHARGALVILRQLSARLRGVRQERWHGDFCGVIKNFLHAGVRTFVWLVAESIGLVRQLIGIAAAAMGVAGGVVQKEWLFRLRLDESFAVVSHLDGTAAVGLDFGFEEINVFRPVMMFADAGGAVPGFGEQHGEGFHPREAAEFVEAVEVSVMSVAMIVQAGENDRAAGAAAGGGCEGVAEERTVGGEPVDVGRYGSHIAITSERGAEVIGDDKDDILLRRKKCYGYKGRQRQ